ncbi:MAG TPA: PmeII family type II restriction endonuclease, partial [Parafilimonas sp.]|nr:PmeII family type II restriction endonuclease [Parafilimonas sp.]
DLEFDLNNIRYIITIKSGPNWGNASAINKLRTDFKTAMKTLRTSNSQLNVIAINGCCYGRDNKSDKGDYFKYCGQKFWEFISGDSQLYTKIIEPLGHQAKERNEEFLESYARMINIFTKEFADNFCKNNGDIDWVKLVRFNLKTYQVKVNNKLTSLCLTPKTSTSSPSFQKENCVKKSQRSNKILQTGLIVNMP